jgi:CheY-like chemotaxis protein
MAEVRILVIDDDVATQRALKNVLESEGWRIRIIAAAARVLNELAGGGWSLVIANVALTDLRGPVFAILKELAVADSYDPQAEASEQVDETSDTLNGDGADGPQPKKLEAEPIRPEPRPLLRVLFLVPPAVAKQAQPMLERDGLPYVFKPYHLHDFLEKISDLLLETGAIEDPIRSMRGLRDAKKRTKKRAALARRGSMFASREDYQMTEEEMVEWERQEEEERKKRLKEQKEREHLG